MVVLFALAMFLSASLLFIVQPMVAKLLLPSLGGSAAVWTTCMLFFQAMLLAGYGYAHLGARQLSPRRQMVLHGLLMIGAVVVLPFTIPDTGLDPSEHPTLWLLAVLFLSIGLPFFVVSTTAPLLQHLFAHTTHRDADDPYFLYGASNLGSMAALVAYPVLVQPMLGVRAQTTAWAAAYAVFVLLMVGCFRTVFGVRERRTVDAEVAPELTWRQRLRWVMLAAVPSSLMLGVTQHLTTDVAPVPLLWVLPLALYLATFVLVFSRRPVWLPESARNALPIALLAALAAIEQVGGTVALALHGLSFFLFALFYHGTLARERPHPTRLTEYFLLLSIGGVFGGLFNALAAPLIFDRLIEYHVVMFLAVACIAPDAKSQSWRTAAAVGLAACAYLYTFALISTLQLWLAAIYFGAVVAVVWKLPRVQNVVIAVLLAVGAWVQFYDISLLYDRSFFSTYKVYEQERDGVEFRALRHGTTVHGVQATAGNAATIARSYHHPSGPVGDVMDVAPPERMLVIGLGVGAMAAYAGPRTHVEFYEIDPLVHDIARQWFTYLSACGERCSVSIGDGRRLLAESDATFDLIMLDAYNSGSVPSHLLTREALQLYLDHLKPGGLLVFNVSNRYVDVAAVVGALCADAGIHALEYTYDPPPREAYAEWIDRSQFVVASKDAALLERIAARGSWRPSPQSKDVWTDDSANVLSVVIWD